MLIRVFHRCSSNFFTSTTFRDLYLLKQSKDCIISLTTSASAQTRCTCVVVYYNTIQCNTMYDLDHCNSMVLTVIRPIHSSIVA